METVKPYQDIREMTPDVLLELTQSHKLNTLKSTFKHDLGLARELAVTEKEIEAMGETLKMILFFVSPSIMRDAMLLAHAKGVLIPLAGWLQHGNR